MKPELGTPRLMSRRRVLFLRWYRFLTLRGWSIYEDCQVRQRLGVVGWLRGHDFRCGHDLGADALDLGGT